MRAVIIRMIAEYEQSVLFHGQLYTPADFVKDRICSMVSKLQDGQITFDHFCFWVQCHLLFQETYTEPTKAEILRFNLQDQEPRDAKILACISRIPAITEK